MAEPETSSERVHRCRLLKLILELGTGLRWPWPLRRRIRRIDLDANPNLAWNEYISLIGLAPYEELTPVQRVAHLAFAYDAEVQNGGHMQYFVNSAGRRWRETLDALTEIEADEQRAILAAAAAKVEASPFPRIDSVHQYSDIARSHPLREFDGAYYAARPTIIDLLKRYLDRHFSDFIDVIEDR